MMTPATDVTMRMDLLVRDIGAPDRRTRLELGLNSSQALGALYVDATEKGQQDRIDADVSVRMVGLDLAPPGRTSRRSGSGRCRTISPHRRRAR